MGETRIRLLERMPIFGGINGEILTFLLERSSLVTIPEGEYFFREGSRGTSTFVLEEGSISIVKAWNGRDYLLRHLETGDCFGEVALLDFGPRSASVLADVNCTAIEITARDLLEVSKRNFEQFAMIYMNLGRELSRRLRAADERVFRARLAGDSLAADYAFSPS